MAKKKKKIDPGADASGFGHNPFAAALAGESLPDAPEEVLEALEAKKEQPDVWDLSKSPQLVLRRDTKRRRGRVVTMIEGIEGATKAQLKQLASQLGKRLGSGASVDSESALLIQGDHRESLPALLTEHGAKKIKTL